MKNPTLQELMEYVDGTLEPSRYREVESMIARSKSLRKEIEMLGAIRTVLSRQLTPPSKTLTAEIMRRILPAQSESLWYRLVKNSSNLFAMSVVLTMIVTVLLSSSGTPSSTVHQLGTTFQSLSDGYNSAYDRIASSIREYVRPIDGVIQSFSGKMLVTGLLIFSLFAVLDSVLGKRVMIRK